MWQCLHLPEAHLEFGFLARWGIKLIKGSFCIGMPNNLECWKKMSSHITFFGCVLISFTCVTRI